MILLELSFMALTITAWHLWHKALCIPFFIAYLYFRWRATQPKRKTDPVKLDLSAIKQSKVSFNKRP